MIARRAARTRAMPTIAVAILLCTSAMQASAKDMRWNYVPGLATSALRALQKTSTGLAESINLRSEDDREDRSPTSPMPPPNNFEPASHLLWAITDVNNDGRPDVFLAVDWSVTQGNSPRSMGALMVQVGRHGREGPIIWRLACETYVFLPDHASSTLRIFPGRGWRPFEFRGQGVRAARYTWRRGADGQMECGDWIAPHPAGSASRRTPPSGGAARPGPSTR